MRRCPGRGIYCRCRRSKSSPEAYAPLNPKIPLPQGERKRVLLATKSLLPPTLFLGLAVIVLRCGIGNVVLQRPDRRRGRARRMLGVGRGGVDLIGHGAKTVRLDGKAGLVVLHAFRLRNAALLQTIAPLASATAATAAAALAARLAILARLLLAALAISSRFCFVILRAAFGGLFGFGDLDGLRMGADARIGRRLPAPTAFALFAATATAAPAAAAATFAGLAFLRPFCAFALAGFFALGRSFLGLFGLGFFLFRVFLIFGLRLVGRHKARLD